MLPIEQIRVLQSHIEFCVNHTRGVYFVQAVEGGPIKIGRTTTGSENRLKDLQCGSPVKLRVIAWLPSWGTELEYMLHHYLAEWRLHGEWFEDSPEVYDTMETLTRFSSLAF